MVCAGALPPRKRRGGSEGREDGRMCHTPRVREVSADRGSHGISHPLHFMLKCTHAHSQPQHLDHSSALFTAPLCTASTAGWSPGLRIGRVGDGEMAFEKDEKGKSDKFCGSGQVGE